MKTVIYYFSGTGNSLKVAKDIAVKLKDTEIIQICKDNMDVDSIILNKSGIVFPVYFSGMPLIVKDFIEKIKIKSGAYIFTIVTFARASDASINQLEKILNSKGSELSAAFKILNADTLIK